MMKKHHQVFFNWFAAVGFFQVNSIFSPRFLLHSLSFLHSNSHFRSTRPRRCSSRSPMRPERVSSIRNSSSGAAVVVFFWWWGDRACERERSPSFSFSTVSLLLLLRIKNAIPIGMTRGRGSAARREVALENRKLFFLLTALNTTTLSPFLQKLKTNHHSSRQGQARQGWQGRQGRRGRARRGRGRQGPQGAFAVFLA